MVSVKYQPNDTLDELSNKLNFNSGFNVSVEKKGINIMFTAYIKYNIQTYDITVTVERYGSVYKNYIYFPDGELFLRHVIYLCGGLEGSEENIMPRRYVALPRNVVLLNAAPGGMGVDLATAFRPVDFLGSKWNCDCFEVNSHSEKGVYPSMYTLSYQRSSKYEKPYDHTDTRVYLSIKRKKRMIFGSICFLTYNEASEDRYYMEFVEDIVKLAGGRLDSSEQKAVIVEPLPRRYKLPSYLPSTYRNYGFIGAADLHDIISAQDTVTEIENRNQLSSEASSNESFSSSSSILNKPVTITNTGDYFSNHSVTNMKKLMKQRKKDIIKNEILIEELRSVISEISSM